MLLPRRFLYNSTVQKPAVPAKLLGHPHASVHPQILLTQEKLGKSQPTLPPGISTASATVPKRVSFAAGPSGRSPKRTVFDQRDAQLRVAQAGAPRRVHAIGRRPWPQASASVTKMWNDRNSVHSRLSTAHMATQARMLWLYDLPANSRIEEFEKQGTERNLAASTALSSWLSAARILGVPDSIDDKRYTDLLKRRNAAHPVFFSSPVTDLLIDQLLARFNSSIPATCAVIAACWILGQRISDMLQLSTNDLTVSEDVLIITISRGKVVGSQIQPYSLPLRLNRFPAQALLKAREVAIEEGRLFLLSHENDTWEREALGNRVSSMLATIDDNLELRSIRRGGLQYMAAQGMELPEILLFSKHSSEDMLRRYLNWGRLAKAEQNQMLDCIEPALSFLDHFQ